LRLPRTARRAPQTSARANGLAIDNLEFEYPILTQPPEHLREGPKEGQYIRGLFLEGAQWSKEDACLAEPAPMQLFAPMPVVHFKPIEARRERTRGIYKCPMYLYPVRTGTRERPSYMGVVDLRCAEGVEPSQWIKRGTALLLALAS
jgi:dynein heavy chain